MQCFSLLFSCETGGMLLVLMQPFHVYTRVNVNSTKTFCQALMTGIDLHLPQCFPALNGAACSDSHVEQAHHGSCNSPLQHPFAT